MNKLSVAFKKSHDSILNGKERGEEKKKESLITLIILASQHPSSFPMFAESLIMLFLVGTMWAFSTLLKAAFVCRKDYSEDNFFKKIN